MDDIGLETNVGTAIDEMTYDEQAATFKGDGHTDGHTRLQALADLQKAVDSMCHWRASLQDNDDCLSLTYSISGLQTILAEAVATNAERVDR